MVETPPTEGLEHPPISRGQVTAAVVGNALEFYDFTTYAFFAVQIGHAFFPGRSAFESLMASLAAFGAGFFSRPVGAAVIGRFADRRGRRPAMLLSFALMGAAIMGLAATPSFALIGWAAPVLAVTFRLAQGFALGGEVGPTTAFLIEAAPPARRGLIGCWQSASQSVSSLVGGLVGVSLSAVLDAHTLDRLGWRIAFALGALVLPFGLFLRRNLPETLHRAEQRLDAHPERADLRGHLRVILVGLVLVASLTISTYVLIYMTTYAQTTLGMKPGAAFGATVVNGAAGIVFTLLGGALSDRFGRKPVMITARIAFLAGLFPGFVLMAHGRDVVSLYGCVGVLGAFNALSTGTSLVCLTESLRKEVRGLGLAVIYALAVAIFGGATQLVVAWLLHVTGDPLAPAAYVAAAGLVGLGAMLMMSETAPARVSG